MRTTIGLIVMCLIFIQWHDVYAQLDQMADCDFAAERCYDHCAQLSIYDPEAAKNLENSTFGTKCDSACLAGLNVCRVQESKTGCDTFHYHCLSSCPTTVVNPETGLAVDTFALCSMACLSGQDECRVRIKGKIPPRKRTGPFEACQEAKTACNAQCLERRPVDNDTGQEVGQNEYSALCAKACEQAIIPCQKAAVGAAQCQVFADRCWDGCPGTTVSDAGYIFADSNSETLCEDACWTGRYYCKQILRLPIDYKDYPDHDPYRFE